jgi:hypothetical protein
LGCVTDWQQETRGLFLFGREWRDMPSGLSASASIKRPKLKTLPASAQFSSLGIAKWPHLPQTNRPSAMATIGLNSSPEIQ